jgi:hypothetical protein
MRKLLLVLSLATLLFACNEQLDPSPDVNPEQILSTTDGAVADLIAVSGERIIPVEGIRAMASGPAAMPRGAEQSLVSQSAVSSIAFEPNAGVIWRNSNTGETHLLALQLPGTPGRPVKWESLGTAWEGSEFMTMDNHNFYVVWGNAVYKAPKRTPNSWSLLIPNNGEDIKGIVGDDSGAHLARGNRLYSFSEEGGIISYVSNASVIANTRLMTGHLKSNLSFVNYFLTTNHELWVCHNPTGLIEWYKPYWHSPFEYVYSMVSNPMTNLLYERTYATGSRINTIDQSGNRGWLSNHNFNWWGQLVVNNGYVWVMDDTLSQLMTSGSQKGKSAYNESGWGGIQLACAHPTLVIN